MHRMNVLVCAAAAAVLVCVSCGSRSGKSSTVRADDSTSVAAVPDTIAPLIPGEVRLKNDAEAFGKEIPLKGDTVKLDEIFQVGVSTMILKDSLMLVCCRDQRPFRLYSLPELELKGVYGMLGRGPGELISPEIWPFQAPGYLALATDEFRDNKSVYKIRNDGTQELLGLRMPSKYMEGFDYTRGFAAKDDDHIVFTHRSSLYYYDGSDTTAVPDSTVRKLADLRLGKYSAGSTMNIGSLGVNFQYERAVWAYKYAKRVMFCDFDGNVRAVDFRSSEDGEAEGVGMDSNITHYWKLYAGDRYVWLLYSGRTPMDVVAEQEKDIYYIYVEQFDWNGNPVRRYRLDNWGFISVDEDSGTLYFLSNVSEYPFFKYTLLQ